VLAGKDGASGGAGKQDIPIHALSDKVPDRYDGVRAKPRHLSDRKLKRRVVVEPAPAVYGVNYHCVGAYLCNDSVRTVADATGSACREPAAGRTCLPRFAVPQRLSFPMLDLSLLRMRL